MKPNKAFKLVDKVDAYVISLHVRNLMATYGDKETLEIIRVLFMDDIKQKKTNKRKVG
jgi:hypothetical protein